MEKQRVVYFDYLRVFAIICVIVIHIVCNKIFGVNPRSIEWNVYNFYDSIVRWGVPVFVMISGSLFLSRNFDIEKIYSKYILRLIIGYLVWAFFYATVSNFLFLSDFTFSVRGIIASTISGAFHMWFIPMIIGLYIIVPFLHQILRNKKLTIYFLLVSFVYGLFIPELRLLSKDFLPYDFLKVVERFYGFADKMDITFVTGFVFYFVLGHYLKETEFNTKNRKVIYALGVCGFLFTIVLESIVAWKTGKACDRYYGYHMVNVAFEAVSIFVYFKYNQCRNERINKIVEILSKCCLGVYFVHIFILSFLHYIFGDLPFNPMISVVVMLLGTTIISFSVSYLLSKIPLVGKWIV